MSARAYVVLGAKVDAQGQPSSAMERRVRAAVALWRADPGATFVVTGGGAPFSEADVGGELAVSWGLPRDALVLEREARNTRDNARLTRALLGDRAVVVVTCDRHARRARWAFAPQFSQLTVVPVPSPPSPRASAREALALAWTALRGGR